MAEPLFAAPTRRRTKLKANPQPHLDREVALKRIYADNKHTYDHLAK